MNRYGLLVLCAIFLLVAPGRLGHAQFNHYYEEPGSEELAAMEEEALTEALDEFDLHLDSPELEDMDGGDIWDYIEHLRREKDESGQDVGETINQVLLPSL